MNRKRLIYTVLFLTYVLTLSGIALSAEEPELKTLGSYSRIILPIDKQASFKVQSAGDSRVVLQIDRQSMPDWNSLRTLNDQRVRSVAADQAGLDKVAVAINLAQPGIEYFAYSQPNPPAIVIDLWPKALAAAKSTTSEDATRSLATVDSGKTAKVKKINNTHRAEKISNVMPLDFSRNFFQKYPLPVEDYSYSGAIFKTPTDEKISERWTWFKSIKDESEGVQEVLKLAKSLFEKKKYALTIKACEVFERDFINNKNQPEVRFLKSLALRELAKGKANEEIIKDTDKTLQELMVERDQSGKSLPFANIIRAYFAEKAIAEKNWFSAIDHLEALTKVLPQRSNDFQGATLALAQAYMQAKQYRRAERVFSFIAQDYSDTKFAKEARYRIAAMLSIEPNYLRAEDTGLAALNEYPEYRKVRTESLFNLAEAQFWLRKFKQSQATFKKYIVENKSNTLSAIAYVRLGELAELTGQGAHAAKENYLAAQNNFPFSIGSQTASIRIARLDLPNESEHSYHKNALEEIYRSEKKDPKLRLIAQNTLIDFYIADKEADKALQLINDGLAVSSGDDLKIFQNHYRRAVLVKLANLVKQKQFPAALAYYEKEKEWFTENLSRTYQLLAEANRELGLYGTSNRYMSLYLDARKKEGRGLASVGEESSSIKVARAKNSFAEGKYAESLTALAGLGGNDSDLEYIRAISYARLGKLDEAMPHADKALAALAEIKKQIPENELQSKVSELGSILAQRGERNRDFRDMESTVARVQRMLPQKEDRFEFLFADSLWYQRKHEAAISAYQKAIAEFAKSDRVDRAQYNLGMSHLSIGKKAEAVKILTELRDKSQNVWSQSAKQELELIQWEQKYSSVLKSLPPSGLGIVN